MTEIRTGQQYLRQLGIYNPDEHQDDSVTFVGVGGIGSFAAFGVAKLGVPKITLIDPDVVEPHNQPNQMYDQHDVALPKVTCLHNKLALVQPGLDVSEWHGSVGNPDAAGRDGEYSGELSGAVVSGLDSMAARTEVWQAIKLNPRVPLYIDARIGGQLIVIFTLNPVSLDQIDAYEATLHSDEEAEELPCTERGIIDVGLMIGSLITRNLRHHFTGKPVPNILLVNQETLNVTKGDWS